MLKRNKGIIFLVIGCILLLTACGWYLYNIIEDKNAGKSAANILNLLDEAEQENGAGPVITVEGDDFCGKVIINKLSVELPVYDKWSYARLKSAPCRYSGSVQTNDMIIAAHNYKSHFGSLGRLAVGDEVEFLDTFGQSHLYEVCELAKLDGTAVSDMHAGGWDFTLFTCTKSGEQRVTVRCNKKQ